MSLNIHAIFYLELLLICIIVTNGVKHLITDITSIKYPDNVHEAVKQGIADNDLYNFYDTIKPIIISNDLLRQIVKIFKSGIPDNKLILYYSGHGIKDSIVMPDRNLLSFIKFRDCVVNSLPSYTEIFWILDCCNPKILNLPYKLEGNSFVLSSEKIECVSQPILLITSSNSGEKSIATKVGSLFSRYLFQILTILNNTDDPIIKVTIPIHKNRNLRRLIGNLASSIRKMHTGYSQTVSIYSSYVLDPVLWLWIGSYKDYDIVTDLSLSILIIRDKIHESYVSPVILSPIKIFNSLFTIPTELTISKSNPILMRTSDIINPYDLLYPE